MQGNFPGTLFVPSYGGPLMQDIRYQRRYLRRRAVLQNSHLPAWNEGGLAGVVVHVSSMDDVALLLSEVEEADGTIDLARHPKDVVKNSQVGIVSLLLCASFEDVGRTPELLAIYERLGTVSFALSLNEQNLLVSGCAEEGSSGLSGRGRKVVRNLCDRGILIDVSHVSDAGFWDVLEVADRGVIASHSNARAICDNPRNLTDQMIIALAERGGAIGLSTYPTLITAEAEPTIDHLLDHFEHIRNLVGVDHLMVGADFVDFILEFVMPMIRATDYAGNIYGEQHLEVKGLSSFSDLPNFREILLSRGYQEDEVARIQAENFLRVWEEAEITVAEQKTGADMEGRR